MTVAVIEVCTTPPRPSLILRVILAVPPLTPVILKLKLFTTATVATP